MIIISLTFTTLPDRPIDCGVIHSMLTSDLYPPVTTYPIRLDISNPPTERTPGAVITISPGRGIRFFEGRYGV